MLKMYFCLDDLEKHTTWVRHEKLCGVLGERDVNGRLLLADKSLYSWSQVCVPVGSVRSFILCIWLRHTCMLSPLFLIV